MSSIFEPGDVLDEQIELVEFIKGGGQAEIWAVRNIHFLEHSRLALKVRYTPWDQRTEHKFQLNEARLEAETQLLGSVMNRYIMRPHFKVGQPAELRGKTFAVAGLVMDLASEGSLLDFYQGKAFSTFSTADKFNLLHHMASGLHALKSLEIIHNDIKPANILVSNEAGHYLPRYSDFGYAFRKGDTIVRGGTKGYMAPELNTIDPSYESDVFSLGVTFYELLTGRHPIDQIDSHGDRLKAVEGYFSTHEYIDSTPLRELQCKPLTDLIQQMCARTPESRPAIEDIIEVLDAVTTDAKSRLTVRPEDAYPMIANRFRWSEILHRRFDEMEVVIFLTGTKAQSDPRFLVEQLTRERIFGYSIFRVLGSSDYLLRVWIRSADRPSLDAVLRAYAGERGSYEEFHPSIRRPRPGKTAVAQYARPAEVLKLLKDLNDGDARALRRAKNSKVVLGETKTSRERGSRRRNAIRAASRVKLKRALSDDLTKVIAEKFYEMADEQRGVREVEVLADSGHHGAPAEFLMIAELDNFHGYGGIMDRVEEIITGLVGADNVNEFRSLFEMDPVSEHEVL